MSSLRRAGDSALRRSEGGQVSCVEEVVMADLLYWYTRATTRQDNLWGIPGASRWRS
jgi:hypothetical protein